MEVSYRTNRYIKKLDFFNCLYIRDLHKALLSLNWSLAIKFLLHEHKLTALVLVLSPILNNNKTHNTRKYINVIQCFGFISGESSFEQCSCYSVTPRRED
jgi:hypothetical protein